jgi:hypothetical protein
MHSLALIVALATPKPQDTLIVQTPTTTLQLEIATTEQQREQGLMNRTHLAPHSGMLFVFPSDQPVSFWMKNTLISLDMVFVDANGTVRQVIANVPTVSPALPDDQIPLEQSSGKYVIELAAGAAAKDGIVPGAVLGNIKQAPTATP